MAIGFPQNACALHCSANYILVKIPLPNSPWYSECATQGQFFLHAFTFSQCQVICQLFNN